MDEAVKRLRRLDCCSVSDALDKLGMPGWVGGLSQQASQQCIAGKVVTTRLVAASAPQVANRPLRHLGTSAIEAASPGDVIVMQQNAVLEAGCWGGILTLAAKLRGVAGVIADGPVRDIDEARSLDFPIYSRSLTARTARGRVVEAECNEPLTINDVLVRPGDYVIADASGVVFIPADKIHVTLETAELIADREAVMAKALLSGMPSHEVMGADYEHMLHPNRS